MKLAANERNALIVMAVGLGGWWWLSKRKQQAQPQQGLANIPGRKWGWGTGNVPAFQGEGQVVPGVPLGNIVWQQYV